MPAPKYDFSSPNHIEIDIVHNKKAFGKLRIKPSTILWKPKGKQKFNSVQLDDFIEAIRSGAISSSLVGQ